MRNRMEEIKAKGFNIMTGRQDTPPIEGTTGYNSLNVDFNKIKIGAKTLEDAVMEIGHLKKINPRLADKDTVLRAINNYDLKTMREISDFFFRTSGIYSRILKYLAVIYRYDWFLTPYVNDKSYGKDKILDGFNKCLTLLDNFNAKKVFGDISLKVLQNGAYYGYKVEAADNKVVLQELPVNYCRSRFSQADKPAVEFNMKFFDEMFRDTEQKMRVLKMFPKEFARGYSLYKQRKLPAAFNGDTPGWYLLDPEMTVKFNCGGADYPAFISVIPLILDLDTAQELDRKKTMQRLLKIIIQKMPIDKNGDLIFDVEEAQQLHNNAVQMLGKAIGIDVLTTFADTSVETLSDSSALSAQGDDLERVERQLYNEAGVPKMLFNTDGNLALEKSILTDAGTMYNLLLQFESFLNDLIKKYNTKPKKVNYQVEILTTTIYNYQELAKLYKEQVQLGYSKVMPQVALGHSQSSVLANAYFENEVLELNDLFVPPMMSSTMSANAFKGGGNNNSGNNQSKSGGTGATNLGNGGGRPQKPDDQKSEKTIQNKESAK